MTNFYVNPNLKCYIPNFKRYIPNLKRYIPNLKRHIPNSKQHLFWINKKEEIIIFHFKGFI